jgi:hypothetical protein
LIGAVVLLAVLLILWVSAASAGQGWYLMLPPVSEEPTLTVRVNAPFRDWTTEDSFGRVDECREARMFLANQAERNLKDRRQQLHDLDTTPKGAALRREDPGFRDFIKRLVDASRLDRDQMRMSKCITTDDPRLAR